MNRFAIPHMSAKNGCSGYAWQRYFLMAGAALALFGTITLHAATTDSGSGTSPVGGASDIVDRQVVVTVLSWYSAIGTMNGSKSWRLLGYNYEGAKGSNGIQNYPIQAGVKMPSAAPQIGSPEYSQLQYQAALTSLRQMQGAGFDVAAFDMLPMPGFDQKKPLNANNVPFAEFQTFRQWLKAGADVGMKVAIFADIKNQSADYPKGHVLNVQEWVKTLSGALDNVGQAPAIWKIGGKPVVIHFGTDSSVGSPPARGAEGPDGGWRDVLKKLRDRGRSFFFFADVRPRSFHGSEEWAKFANGVHMFAPASPASFLVDKQTEMSASSKVPYMWTVSPGYYNANVNAYTEPDFHRIHNTYIAAMKAGAKLMNVLTWNDFGENTDIAPSADKGRTLLDIFSYYNEWFKSGVQPSVASDKVILAYPMRIPDKVHTKSPTFGAGAWVSPPYAPKVFYWANVRAGRSLEVAGVGKVDLPSGLSMGTIGLISPGTVVANIGGKTLRLPRIQKTSIESQRKGTGGLEYRYVSLTP